MRSVQPASRDWTFITDDLEPKRLELDLLHFVILVEWYRYRRLPGRHGECAIVCLAEGRILLDLW